MAQRYVHIGDKGTAAPAGQGSDGNHLPGQADGILQGFHKGAASRLYIQDNAVAAGRQFFTHDGGGNKGNTVHGGRHIPQGIKLFICRNHVARLADKGQAVFIDNAEKFFPWYGSLKSGDTLQLIHGPAGMSQAPSAHLGHLDAAGCHNGTCHQGCLIPHAAGAVFIRLDSLNRRQIHHVPGMRHLQGQVRYLPVIHALKINSHQHGRHLIIRNVSCHKSAHHIGNLLRQKGTAPLFLFDQVIHSHITHLPSGQVQSSPEAAGPGYIPCIPPRF